MRLGPVNRDDRFEKHCPADRWTKPAGPIWNVSSPVDQMNPHSAASRFDSASASSMARFAISWSRSTFEADTVSTSPPVVTVMPDWTRRGTVRTPDRFASRPSQSSCLVAPSAESAPMPVMTTRRLLDITKFPEKRLRPRFRLCVATEQRTTCLDARRLLTRRQQDRWQHAAQHQTFVDGFLLSTSTVPSGLTADTVLDELRTTAPLRDLRRRLQQHPDLRPSAMLLLRIRNSIVQELLRAHTMPDLPRRRVRDNTIDCHEKSRTPKARGCQQREVSGSGSCEDCREFRSTSPPLQHGPSDKDRPNPAGTARVKSVQLMKARGKLESRHSPQRVRVGQANCSDAPAARSQATIRVPSVDHFAAPLLRDKPFVLLV